MVDWLFLPQIFGPWWGPTKAFCRFVNVDGMGIVLAGVGNTSTLHVLTEIFCTDRWWGTKN